MSKLVLRGMAERKLRSVLTAMAVLLGVAMIAGTLVQTGQINRAFEEIEEASNAGTDVVVIPHKEFSSQFMTTDAFDAALVDRVAAVDGVRVAQGTIEELGSLVVDGEKVESTFAPTFVVADVDAPFDDGIDLLQGRSPEGAGEIMVNRALFEDNDLAVGDRVGVATRTGVQDVTLVGAFDLGDGVSLGGATVITAPLADVQRWFGHEGKVSAIEVAAEDGISPAALARAIREVVPRDLEVRTGSQNAAQNAEEINDEIGGFLTPALLAFAGAALLVGAFIIFNTFSITVAQRTREFGMLRTLGATRRQIVGAVTGEALLIGIAASLLGLLGGLGFAQLLGALFDAAGWGIPRSGMRLDATIVAVALAVGIGVTVLAALVPAVRATRVPPVAALSTAPPVIPLKHRRIAAVIAGLVSLAGLGLLIGGLFGGGSSQQQLGTLAGGAVLLMIGVALTARHVVRPIAAVVGRPVERAFGIPGRLARENATRNPGRTAATSAALMVGLGLVVFVAVFASGLKSSLNRSLDDLVKADLIVLGDNFTPVAGGAGEALRAVPGVAATSSVFGDQVQVNGAKSKAATDYVEGVDLDGIGRVYEFEWLGDGVDPAALARTDALVEEQFAKAHSLARGERFTVQTATGGKATLRVAAIYEDPQLLNGMVVGAEAFRALSQVRDPFIYMLGFAPGADPKATRAGVETAVERFPGTQVNSIAEHAEEIGDQLDQLVYMLYALLAMSVFISLFGIANSLFLSIHERTREFGLLRAIGATQDQVRRIVRYESVITAVIGGLLGIVVGLVFAGLITAALSDLGLSFSLPLGQLAVFLVLAVGVGMAAAVIPARRGARIDVLEALRYE